MVENCPNLICIPRQFEYVGDPSQMRRGPTGTDAKDSPGLQAKCRVTLQRGKTNARLHSRVTPDERPWERGWVADY